MINYYLGFTLDEMREGYDRLCSALDAAEDSPIYDRLMSISDDVERIEKAIKNEISQLEEEMRKGA